MANCGTIKYNEAYFDVVMDIINYDNLNMLHGEYVKQELYNLFEEGDANKILEAIYSKSGPTFGPDFNIEAAPEPTPNRDYKGEDADWDNNAEASVLSNFNREDTGGRVAYDKMLSDFRKRLIESLIFNIKTNTRVNLKADTDSGYDVVSDAIYNYKRELLQTLWAFIDNQGILPSAEVQALRDQEYEDEIQFTKQISLALRDFNNARFIRRNKEIGAGKGLNMSIYDVTVDGKTKNAYIAYVVLSNFNKIIENNCGDIVKIKKEYKNSRYHYMEMYEYQGPQAVQDFSPSNSEDADISKYSSKLVQILCDYIPEVDENGNASEIAIGFTGFCRVMSIIKTWAENSSTNSVAYKTLFTRATNADGNLIRGNEIDWNTIIEEYLNATNSFTSEYFTTLGNKIRGIQKYIFTKLDTTGRPIGGLPIDYRHVFAAQADRTVSCNYASYRYKDAYDEELGKIKPLTGIGLIDDYINHQTYFITDAVKQSAKFFRSNKERFKQFLTDHNVQWDEKNPRVFIISDGTQSATITVTGTSTRGPIKTEISLTGELNEEAYVKPLIEDLLHIIVPDDYKNVLQSIGRTSLIDAFGKVLGYTFDAATDYDKNIYAYTLSVPKLREVSNDFKDAAKFLSLVYGEETMNTLKNGEGNNLPLYQLGALVNDIRYVISDLESGAGIKSTLTGVIKSSVFTENYFVKELREGRNVLGNIWIRSDIQNRHKIKQSKALSVGEVSYLAIVKDFYEALQTKGEVKIQPITFADKARHFLFSIKTNIAKTISGKSLQSTLTAIADSFAYIGSEVNSDHQIHVDEMINTIKTTRSGKTRRQIINILSRFNYALNEDWHDLSKDDLNQRINAYYKLTDEKLVAEFDKLRAELKSRNLSKGDLQAAFTFKTSLGERIVVDFYPEFDAATNKDGICDINELVCQEVDLYLRPGDAFRRRIKREQFNFANDLINAGFKLNAKLDDGLRRAIEAFSKRDPETMGAWYDSISGIMKVARIRKNGKEIIPTATQWAEICAPEMSAEYDIELNPILESYYYGDILLSNELDVLLFGSSSSYPSKVKAGKDFKDKLDEDYYRMSEANRFVTQTKRTVPAGATRYRFFTNMHYGIDDTLRIAAMKDINAPLWNMTGGAEQDKTTDGCGLSSAIQAILENWSLLDASVGNDKKTIFMGYDQESGMPIELKWAVFAITNNRRKSSPVSTTMHLEEVFRKMHSFAFDPGKRVLLQKYYDPSRNYVYTSKYDSERQLTLTDYIYKYDNETGKYYRLNSIASNSLDNTYYAEWQEATETGDVIGEVIPTTGYINNIYDIDQAFGGAYTMKYDEDLGILVDSDENNFICARLVCEEDLKNKFLSYVVNHSAIKVGVNRINPSNSFAPGHEDDTLDYFEMPSRYGGVQMDAEHEVEGGTVTEMSQLISALIQNGYSTDVVDEIYASIGRVTKQAIDDLVEASAEERAGGDTTQVYKILGKALIKSFSNGQKDTMGLAQSFISLAETKLEETKYKLPFSARTVKPMFMAAITSALNSSSIKRKYPGLAGVQTPSYGIVQYFAPWGDEGKDYYNFKEISDYIRNNKAYREALERHPSVGGDEELRKLCQVYNPNFDSSRPADKTNPKYIDSIIRRAFFDPMLNADGTLDNPFLVSIDSYNKLKELDIEDTILVRRKGSKGVSTFDVHVLDSISKFDYYRNCIDLDEYEVYRWIIRPRDLKQCETWVTVKDGNKTRKLNLYDFDSVRAAFYLQDELNDIENKDYTPQAIDRYVRSKEIRHKLLDKYLSNFKVEINGETVEFYWKDIVDRVKNKDKAAIEIVEEMKYYLNSITQDNHELLDKVQDGEVVEIPFQESLRRPVKLSAITEAQLNDYATKAISTDPDIDTIGSIRAFEDLSKLWLREDIDEVEYERRRGAVETWDKAISKVYSEIRPTNSLRAVHVDFRSSQIIAGRTSGELGLHYGDSIHKIRTGKEKFFLDRLNDLYTMPEASVPKVDYDGVLYTADGKKVLLKIAGLDWGLISEEGSNLGTTSNSRTFKAVDGKYYYNGEEVSSTEGILFQTYIDDTGAEWDMVQIQSLKALDELKTSGTFLFNVWNCTPQNLVNILKFTNEEVLDEDGNIIPGKSIRINGVPISNFDELKEEQKAFFAQRLNAKEQNNLKIANENLARQRFTAFTKSLGYIATRIPAQSMQSFTSTEIVNFIETDVNDVYMSRVIAWLEGSDYDIDKWYAMGQSLLKNGSLATLSDIQFKYNASSLDLNALPTPKGIKFTTTANKNNEYVSQLYRDGCGIETYVDFIENEPLISIMFTEPTFSEVLKINIPEDAVLENGESLVLNEGEHFVLERMNYDLTDGSYRWIGFTTDSQGNVVGDRISDQIILKSDTNIFPELFNAIVDFDNMSINNLVTKDMLDSIISDDLVVNYDALGEFLTNIYKDFDESKQHSKTILFERDSLDLIEVNDEKKRLFMNVLNTHSGTRLNNNRMIGALRNKVKDGMHKVIGRPSSQINLHTQISFGDLKDVAKESTVGKRETFLNLDCPTAKFIMQEQNMVGRDVIGIAAVSLKGFFASTAYFDNVAKAIEEDTAALLNGDIQALSDEIFRLVKEVVFDVRFGRNHLASLSNLYLKPILRLFENADSAKIFEPFKVLHLTSTAIDTRLQNNLSTYINTQDGSFRFYDCIKDLNKTINYKINGADAISALLSAATDNAKELILAKINATAKFADVYTFLLTVGIPTKDIAKFMISPIFNIVSKYANDDILNPDTYFFNLEKAVSFVTDRAALPYINDKVFKWFITKWEKSERFDEIGRWNGNSVLSHLLFKSDENGIVYGVEAGRPEVILTESPVYKLLEDLYSQWSPEQYETNHSPIDVVLFLNDIFHGPGDVWASHKSSFIDALMHTLNGKLVRYNDSDHTFEVKGNLTEEEFNSIKTAIMRSAKATYTAAVEGNSVTSVNPDYAVNYNIEYGEGDEDTDDVTQMLNSGVLSLKYAEKLYTYLTEFYIPKTEFMYKLKDYANDLNNLQILNDYVLAGSEELSALGRFLGVNKGLATKDFDEYKWITGLEKYINGRYNVSNIKMVPFVFSKFTEDAEYRDLQIKQYNAVKVALPVLDIISKVHHFREMLSVASLNRDLIQHSTAVKLERILAREVLMKKQKSNPDTRINFGYTKSLDAKEFKALENYVNQLLIYNWLIRQTTLQLPIPEGFKIFESGLTKVRETSALPYITINNIKDAGNFKVLMHEHILPALQNDPAYKDNAFIKQLSVGTNEDEEKHLTTDYLRSTIPMSRISCQKLELKFDEILADFNKIANDSLEKVSSLATTEDLKKAYKAWTIGDIFYLYNLLVYGDGYNANALTRLFEDYGKRVDEHSIMGSFYDYLARLDHGDINIFTTENTRYKKSDGYLADCTLKSDKIISDPGQGRGFVYNLTDLQFYLANTSTNKYKFKAELTWSKEGIGSLVTYNENNGKDRVIQIPPIYMNEYPINLPTFAPTVYDVHKMSRSARELGIPVATTATINYSGATEEVYEALIDKLQEMLGNDLKISIFNSKDLGESYTEGMRIGDIEIDSPEAWSRYKNSPGFIHKGTIYLTIGESDALDVPIHEVMHAVCAAMKFNRNKGIRNFYYKLLRSDVEAEENSAMDPEMRQTYIDMLNNPDFAIYLTENGNTKTVEYKEEILVRLLAEELSKELDERFDASIQGIKRTQLRNQVSEIVDSVLGLTEQIDLNKVLSLSLGEVAARFSDSLLNKGGGFLTRTYVELNQKLKTIKSQLIKDGEIKFTGDC